MGVEDTKAKILDAAEWFFAEIGFHATSMRQITARAGENLISVNYHFGSKENLMDAVLSRRIEPLDKIRLERLERVKTVAGVTSSVRDEVALRFRMSLGVMHHAIHAVRGHVVIW